MHVESVDCFIPPTYVTGFHLETDEVSGASRHSFFQTAFDLEKPIAESGMRQMVFPKPKSAAVMRLALRKTTNNRNMIFDLLTGSSVTAKVCLLESKHRKFICCDSDSNCIEGIIPSHLDTLAMQILSEWLDIFEEGKFQLAAEAYLNMSSSNKSVLSRGAWKFVTLLPPVQSFPYNVTQFLSQERLNMELFEKAMHISSTSLSEKWLFKIKPFDAYALLAQYCLTYEVAVKPSNITHKRARMGCFATQNTDKGEPVGFYYGSILFSKYDGPWSGHAYGKRLISATKHAF